MVQVVPTTLVEAGRQNVILQLRPI
jgi:hypothetical protein